MLTSARQAYINDGLKLLPPFGNKIERNSSVVLAYFHLVFQIEDYVCFYEIQRCYRTKLRKKKNQQLFQQMEEVCSYCNKLPRTVDNAVLSLSSK